MLFTVYIQKAPGPKGPGVKPWLVLRNSNPDKLLGEFKTRTEARAFVLKLKAGGR